jgi:hypothetical protein
MRFGPVVETDISRCRPALRTNFQPTGLHKTRFGRGRETDVSRCRPVLRTHYLPSDPPKKHSRFNLQLYR